MVIMDVICVKWGFFDKVCFLNTTSSLHTNDSFRNQTNIEHHKEGVGPITELLIDIKKVVVIDYMHCVCLRRYETIVRILD